VVLHDLRDVVRMTEEAASRVLDETEALVEDSRAAARLVTEARAALGASGAGLAEPLLDQLDTLVERGNRRAIEIMSALEFQDLTSQKVQRAFEVLEEVATRLTRIHNLVTLREEAPGPPPPAEAAPAESPAPDGQPSGQDLADEILQRFRR
jgi:chemotaxis regulatin CheY-phosphate phosphatase CheZ